MRVLILSQLVTTIILVFSTTNAEEDDDVHLYVLLPPVDGEPEEQEEETRKENGLLKSFLMDIKLCLDASILVTKAHTKMRYSNEGNRNDLF